MSDVILNAAKSMGYAVYRGSKLVGSHDVCVTRDGRDVYCIGVNHDLPEPVREALWRHHGKLIVEGLEARGFKIDYERFATRRDWRTFCLA